MITIRFATTADAELIADMSRQTFYDTFAASNTKEDMDKFMNEVFTHEALIKEVERNTDTFLLAYDEEEAVGYVRMRESESPRSFAGASALEIARIYATYNAIGKGVGKALMNACIEIAIARGKKIIWLGVWEQNQRAIDFYTKWGFEKFDTHVFMLGNDKQTDWLMKKTLSTT